MRQGLAPLLGLAVALFSLGCANPKEGAAGETSTTSAEVESPRVTDQGNTRDDLALVRAVRQRLVAEPALSLRAKNVAIIVQEGVVTLRGDVRDRVEHDLVIGKVVSVPGVVRTEDRLAFPGRGSPAAPRKE